MKTKFLYLTLLLLITSCYNKTIQLPDIQYSTITEIQDVSPAYIFYDKTQPDGVELNRKNLIGTTHWLVNVDKRLTLKQILPSLLKLQAKRENAKMHKNESAKNYFSCRNISLNTLGFIEFTNVKYHTEDPEHYIKQLNAPNIITIRFTNEAYIINNEPIETVEVISHLKSLINEESRLLLIFDPNTSFQDYIGFKDQLLNLQILDGIMDPNEYIY